MTRSDPIELAKRLRLPGFPLESWNSQQDDWRWWHSKPINGHTGPDAREILDVHVKRGVIGRPAIPYPSG
jgi:hypothetical protein